VVLHDRLIPAGALDGARDDAELIGVGKEGGGASTPQEEIERLMVQRAREGREVVRLKGGDPFVFGRGGEEAEHLRSQGIDVEVVNGITSGLAAATALGVPLTHRDRAHGVMIVTGHARRDAPPLDWAALARFPGTLVFYMGMSRLPQIAQTLIDHGKPADTPAAPAPGPEGVVRVLTYHTEEGHEVVHVLGRRTSIGRTPDNDLQIDARSVSRHHAVILVGPTHSIIEDLNSTNGVYVNGRRITRNTLKDGDMVVFGREPYVFAVRKSGDKR